MKLEYKRSSLRSFVSIIVLKICFSCLDFFLLLVILAGPHFAMSHFLIIMNLFRFMLAQRIQNFHKILAVIVAQ